MLITRAFSRWSQPGSNRRPPACKAAFEEPGSRSCGKSALFIGCLRTVVGGMLCTRGGTRDWTRAYDARVVDHQRAAHLLIVERDRGPVYYGKWRLEDGTQVKRLLGPAWLERSRSG